MKKIFGLILVFVLCISICACGTASYSDAQILDFDAFVATARENQARADELYKDKPFKITGTVTKIGADSCELNYWADGFPLEVELDSSWLADINVGDQITVVGKFNASLSFPRLEDARMIVYYSQD